MKTLSHTVFATQHLSNTHHPSHTHFYIFFTQLCHMHVWQAIFHSELHHAPSHETLSHTICVTQQVLNRDTTSANTNCATHNLCHAPSCRHKFARHNCVTNHLSHATLPHTPFTTRDIFYTKLCHRQPCYAHFCHTPCLSHRTLSHTIFYTWLCDLCQTPPQSHTIFVPPFLFTQFCDTFSLSHIFCPTAYFYTQFSPVWPTATSVISLSHKHTHTHTFITCTLSCPTLPYTIVDTQTAFFAHNSVTHHFCLTPSFTHSFVTCNFVHLSDIFLSGPKARGPGGRLPKLFFFPKEIAGSMLNPRRMKRCCISASWQFHN